MKANKKISLLLAGVVLAVSFISAVSAQEAVIRTVPEESVWFADGQTEYRVDVWADNTGLNGEATRGVQWRVMVPNDLQPFVTITRAERRPENDFFEGSRMAFERVTTIIEDGQGRGTFRGEGVTSRQGNVASYWFVVDDDFREYGQTSFDLNDVLFLDPDLSKQSYRVENEPFEVIPEGGYRPGDLNCDGDINALDIEPFLTALFDPGRYPKLYPECDINLGDLNGDGVVNALDIEPFIGVLFP